MIIYLPYKWALRSKYLATIFILFIVNNRLTDEKLLNDYQDLKLKVEEQQQLITSQNEMLDEAQSLLQELKVRYIHVITSNRMNVIVYEIN